MVLHRKAQFRKWCYTEKRNSAKPYFRKVFMILSFLNQKGGVGKTTLAIHVADALARHNHRVLLVDADPRDRPSTGQRPVAANRCSLSPACPRHPSTKSFLA